MSKKPENYVAKPWGGFLPIDEGENYNVKRIEVEPGHRLSYQKHSKRSEHWVVVNGTAKVLLDGNEIILSPGESVEIDIGASHRVENCGKETLIFIEVQRGTYFGEDDIVRLEDDYGRTMSS
jgi:mannose-6-phosphate isomerase